MDGDLILYGWDLWDYLPQTIGDLLASGCIITLDDYQRWTAKGKSK